MFKAHPDRAFPYGCEPGTSDVEAMQEVTAPRSEASALDKPWI